MVEASICLSWDDFYFILLKRYISFVGVAKRYYGRKLHDLFFNQVTKFLMKQKQTQQVSEDSTMDVPLDAIWTTVTFILIQITVLLLFAFYYG